MKTTLLTKIGLEQNFYIELPIEVDSFKTTFNSKVGKTPSIVGFSEPKTEFQGTLKGNKLRVWKSVSIYQKNNAATYAIIESTNSGLSLTGVTRIPKTTFWAYLLFGLFFNILVPSLVVTKSQLNERPEIYIPMLIVVFSLSLVWPYFSLRKNVKQYSKDIEKEFFYWTK